MKNQLTIIIITINQKKLIERALNTRISEMFILKNCMKKSLKSLNNQVWISTKSSILKIPRKRFNH